MDHKAKLIRLSELLTRASLIEERDMLADVLDTASLDLEEIIDDVKNF